MECLRRICVWRLVKSVWQCLSMAVQCTAIVPACRCVGRCLSPVTPLAVSWLHTTHRHSALHVSQCRSWNWSLFLMFIHHVISKNGRYCWLRETDGQQSADFSMICDRFLWADFFVCTFVHRTAILLTSVIWLLLSEFLLLAGMIKYRIFTLTWCFCFVLASSLTPSCRQVQTEATPGWDFCHLVLEDIFCHNDQLKIHMPSVLWRCWLGGRKGIRPVKTEWWGVGMVICMERGADLHMAQLMPLPLTVSCSSKIQIGFTSLVPAHLGSPGQRAVKRVCVWSTTWCATDWLKHCHITFTVVTFTVIECWTNDAQ